MLLEADQPLPRALSEGTRALVYTGNAAPQNGAGASTVPLGPGTPAFSSLTGLAADVLAADLYRGAVAEDPTSLVPYELLAFSSSMHSASTRTPTPWSVLIRVDDTGSARRVRWESLANLRPADGSAGPVASFVAEVAESEVKRLLNIEVHERTDARQRWYAAARRDLTNLPVDLTLDLGDRKERIALRDQLTAATERRLEQLEELCRLDAEPPRLVGRLRVVPVAEAVVAPERRQADVIAVDHVRSVLASDGWQVDDVRAEGRGFALRAVRGEQQHLVAARGTWRSAGEDGLVLDGNEILLAAQHGGDYLLFVVENCHDGRGVLYGTFPDPVAVFADVVRGGAVTRVPGPALRSALDRLTEQPTEHP